MPDFLTQPDDPRRQQWATLVLTTYFSQQREDGSPAWTGAMFERFAGGGDAPDVANRFTADDLVAVTMLSVTVDARAALPLLDTDADALSELLAKVPLGLDLINADDSAIGERSHADDLWRLVDRYHRVGETTTSKLLARKRPQLLPVIDSVVREGLGITWSGDYWRQMRGFLRESDRWRFLHQARADAGLEDEVSVLRCFDVLVWMSAQSQCPPPTWSS